MKVTSHPGKGSTFVFDAKLLSRRASRPSASCSAWSGSWTARDRSDPRRRRRPAEPQPADANARSCRSRSAARRRPPGRRSRSRGSRGESSSSSGWTRTCRVRTGSRRRARSAGAKRRAASHPDRSSSPQPRASSTTNARRSLTRGLTTTRWFRRVSLPCSRSSRRARREVCLREPGARRRAVFERVQPDARVPCDASDRIEGAIAEGGARGRRRRGDGCRRPRATTTTTMLRSLIHTGSTSCRSWRRAR